MLTAAGVDADVVRAEIDSGQPLATVEKEHTAYVDSHTVWGVPTFIVDDKAVFLRLLEMPTDDDQASVDVIDRVLQQIDWPLLNEFKHTSHPSLGLKRSAALRARSPSASSAERRVWEDRAVSDDRRMTDAEGLMWRLEKDPYLSSTFGTVSLLDRPPDFDRLKARMERATWNIPRLRWRVHPAAGVAVGADVGRRPRVRHRRPRPAHRPARVRARCASCWTRRR